MEYVNLGGTGLKVSRICLGTMSYGSRKWQPWVLDEEQARLHVQKAIELGINFFDTADAYSIGISEKILGRVIAGLALSRDSIVVGTKVYLPMGLKPNQRGLSRKHIRHAIDASLKRLGMDYVDLYQIHRFDPHTPLEETLEALNDVVRAGKALYIGASSMFAWQFMKSMKLQEANGWARFVCMQNYYNLIYREEEREMLPLCREEKIGVTPWSPLGRGLLTGTRKPDGSGESARASTDLVREPMRPDDSAIIEAVNTVAEHREVSSAQVALAWLLSRPGVTAPIIGATNVEHIIDAVGALALKLTDEETAALEAPYKPHPIVGHSYEDMVERMAAKMQSRLEKSATA